MENRLLQRAKRLEKGALAEIFDTYYPRLYRYLYYQLEDITQAEDFASQVFQKLIQHFQQGHGPDRNLQAWLFQVARNLIIDNSRRNAYRHHQSLGENLVFPSDLEATVQQSLLAQRIQGLLVELSEHQREVIILRFLMEMSLAETADTLQMTVNAVKAHQSRALTTLREKLKEEIHS